MGYAKNGLVEEAVGLSDLVVSGTGVWLPWSSMCRRGMTRCGWSTPHRCRAELRGRR